MVVVEPVFALKALNHELVTRCCTFLVGSAVWFFAVAVYVKKGLVVLIEFVFKVLL